MRKRFLFMLSLLAMAMSSAAYAAGRVAPTLPEDQTPEDGQNYYSGYEFPEWNEYPIFFSSSEGIFGEDYMYNYSTWYGVSSSFRRQFGGQGTSSLTAQVSVDEPSVFIYNAIGSYNNTMLKVYVDGVETRTTPVYNNNRYFEMLSAGKHTITWEYTSLSNSRNSASISDIGCVSIPQISVNLLEPGSIGTEVLYNTDHIKNVKNLKVKGQMNDEDWAKIKMMTYLIELDLSEAVVTNVPDNQFEDFAFLRKVILPEGLTTIGNKSFYNSTIEDIYFPSTVTSIGASAFGSTNLIEAILPDGLASLGEGAFGSSKRLTKVDLGKDLTTISNATFYSCDRLKDLVFPDALKTIGESAFSGCTNLVIKNVPSSVTSIKQYAFYGCSAIVSMKIPDSVTEILWNAFQDCTALKNVELPFAAWFIHRHLFDGCESMESIRLNSATVADFDHNYLPLNTDYLKNVTLQVPSYLVNAYKLDPYWYNAKAFEGFDPNEIEYYEIHKSLTMNGRERFGTNPSARVFENIYLKMNGDEAQNFKDFAIDYRSQLWCTGNNIKATGDLSIIYGTSANRWYFISLPFDMKVSDIEVSDNAQYAIRYYDGANRATIGATGSWKNYAESGVIPAGTGFIYQTNKDTWTTFHAYAEGENKQQIFSTQEFSKPLELNASENAANRGWNLVGNPYQMYYNNHNLNFTAPITVWDSYNHTYAAYSLTDDDYAIRPNEAFFVQCPGEEMQTITFPTTGKQLTNVIESQNAAKARDGKSVSTRQLIDLEVRKGDLIDKTRVVLNEEAKLDYDMGCDASKFMSVDSETPQIYTIGADGTAYAINERPLNEGEMQLGFYTQHSGAFTISMTRCDAQKVYLIDEFEGLTVDLSAQDYGFTAAEGKQEARFRLVVESDEATGIKSLDADTLAAEGETEAIYNLSGQRVGKDYKGIVIKGGKKVLQK